MTEELPDKVDMELKEKDIEQDLVTILNSMNAIRNEQISNKEISNTKKNEYLRLTYRLASCIEGLADENVRRKIRNVANSLKRNEALMNYDYFQDEFWRKTESEFSKTLDQILIASKGDSFSDIEEKYHILQAVKYLDAEGTSMNNRVDVYDTIRPFTDNSEEYNKKTFKKQMRKHGIKNIEEQKGLILKLKNTKNLEKAISTAGELGFTKLRVNMGHKEYEDIWADKHFDSRIAESFEEIEREASREKRRKRARIWRIITYATAPVSIWAIGSLPDSLIERINKYFTKNGQHGLAGHRDKWWNLMAGSITLEAAFGVGAIVAGKLLNNPEVGRYLVYGGGYLVASAAARTFYAMLRDAYKDDYWHFWDHPRGIPSIHSALGWLPFWIHYRTKVSNGEDNFNCVVEFDLKKSKNKKSSGQHEYHSRLENLCEKKVSEEMEENLVWSSDNHYTFGENFSKALLKAEYLKRLGGFAGEQVIDKKNQTWNYYDVIETGPYRKITTMICKKDERYALTYITKSKELDLETLNKALDKKRVTEKRLEKILHLLKAEYMHITRFENRTKKDDYTIVR